MQVAPKLRTLATGPAWPARWVRSTPWPFFCPTLCPLQGFSLVPSYVALGFLWWVFIWMWVNLKKDIQEWQTYCNGDCVNIMSVNSGQKNNQYQHIYICDITPMPPVTDIKFVYEQLHNHSNWLEVQLCAVCCASFLFCQVQPYPPPSRPLVHPCPSPLHGHTHTHMGECPHYPITHLCTVAHAEFRVCVKQFGLWGR